jgi:hypothetical protein
MKKKPYDQMTADELAEATKEFDREFAYERAKPLTKAQRQMLARAGRRGGRPKIGQGAAVVNITVERGLLERADACTKANHLTRAKLVAIGLEAAIAAMNAGAKQRKSA